MRNMRNNAIIFTIYYGKGKCTDLLVRMIEVLKEQFLH